ncbi:MAG: phage tail tube protein, partial [Geminicoccaceae bacterium]
MPKVRAYGADATLLAARETGYGVLPASGWRSLDFKSTDLSSSQPLGEDPLLGRGRDSQDPYRGLVTDEGQIEIPLDLRGTGFWLTALFGDPTTSPAAASGSIAFAAQPAGNSTITINGVTWSFVAGTPSGNQIEIGGTLAVTLTNAAAALNGSANPQVAAATYGTSGGTTLTITHDTSGPAGNAFSLAASAGSNGTVSAPTLRGGGHRHVWDSGGDEIPSHTIEIGHPQLVTPVFFRHLGTVVESLSFEMGQEGPANARLQLVAQGEETASATADATPDRFALKRFSQGRGFIRRGGSPLAGVTGGNLTFSNNLERVRVIREDGRIQAADPTFASAQGQLTVRFDGQTLVSEASDGEPVAFDYGFSMVEGWELKLELFRVFLPKPTYSVS